MDKTNQSKALLTQRIFNQLFAPILAKDEGFDAEQLTQILLTALGQASMHRKWPGIKPLLTNMSMELQRHDCRLQQNLFGCLFQNPVGLAAGLDKNGVAAGIWDVFGVHLGSIRVSFGGHFGYILRSFGELGAPGPFGQMSVQKCCVLQPKVLGGTISSRRNAHHVAKV